MRQPVVEEGLERRRQGSPRVPPSPRRPPPVGPRGATGDAAPEADTVLRRAGTGARDLGVGGRPSVSMPVQRGVGSCQRRAGSPGLPLPFAPLHGCLLARSKSV